MRKKISMLGVFFLLGSPAQAQPTACGAVTDQAAAAALGANVPGKLRPMSDDTGKVIGSICSRRKGRQLVQVTLFTNGVALGIKLPDLLKKQAQDAADDSGHGAQINVVPQAGVGQEAFSATFKAAQVQFTNVATRQGQAILFVQVFNTTDTLSDALKLAKQGAAKLH